MKIAIAGGTGFIGRHLTNALTARGHHVYILTRKPAETEQKNISYVLWQKNGARPETELTDIDVWINLAGKSLFGRWNEKTKEEIATSRLRSVQESARIIQSLQKKQNDSFVGKSSRTNRSAGHPHRLDAFRHGARKGRRRAPENGAPLSIICRWTHWLRAAMGAVGSYRRRRRHDFISDRAVADVRPR